MERRVGIGVVLMVGGGRRVEVDASDRRAPAVLDLEAIEVQEADHVLLGSPANST